MNASSAILSSPVAVRGLGVLFTRGRGVDALARAVDEGWRPPVPLAAPFAPGGHCPAYPVDLQAHGEREVMRRLRRADRFTLLAAVAARDAFIDANLGSAPPERIGLVVATALGPHVTTFHFLDEILTYGDQGGSAIAFSHSVHNAAASYITTLLGLQGPAMTVAQTDFAFHEGLMLAAAWLATGRCDHVLVGAVDELGEVMRYVSDRKCPPPADGRLRPLSFSATPHTVPGEGSFFFLLSRPDGLAPYGHLEAALSADRPPAEPGRLLIDADGLSCDESVYAHRLPPAQGGVSYLALCGGMFIGSAFHAAVAAAMIRRPGTWPAPDKQPGSGAGETVDRATCFRLNSVGAGAWIRFTRG